MAQLTVDQLVTGDRTPGGEDAVKSVTTAGVKALLGYFTTAAEIKCLTWVLYHSS